MIGNLSADENLLAFKYIQKYSDSETLDFVQKLGTVYSHWY